MHLLVMISLKTLKSAVLLTSFLLVPITYAQNESPIQINTEFASDRGVTASAISPASDLVVYVSNQNDVRIQELFIRPSDASDSVTQISPTNIRTLASDSARARSVQNFIFSPDGSYLVFSQQNGRSAPVLFSVDTQTNIRTQLIFTSTILPNTSVDRFSISQDSSTVVFLGENEGSGATNGQVSLYSVPINGGAPELLSVGLPASADVTDFRISSDSNTVVYRADQNTAGLFELFSVPISGGTIEELTTGLVSGRELSNDFAISPDNARVVYIADQTTLGRPELYSVAISGGVATRLSPNLTFGQEVSEGFLISGDSNHVVFRAGNPNTEVFQIFSTPIDSGNTLRLNPNLVSNGSVQEGFKITPDSRRVVYTADQNRENQIEIFSVNMNGGANRRLNRSLPTLGDVSTIFKITPNSELVVYLADAIRDGVVDLFFVPVSGGASRRINAQLQNGGNVSNDFKLSSDSLRVVYRADLNTNNAIEIFTSPLDRSGLSQRLNRTLPNNDNNARTADINRFEISNNGAFVIYQGEQDEINRTEVFAVGFPEIPPITDDLCVPVKTTNDRVAVICL